jgi:hypothetical protein
MADNPEDDFLASSTADPSMTLGEAAYATGAIGSSFAPGAGVADVLGYAPDPFNPGQMLPSFSENVAQGNYIDAGIQTLGLAGDAFYAAAPFTAGIAALPGAGLKTLQAGAKTLRGARSAADLPKSPNTVLDEIYGQDTSIAVGPFALPHELDHKVKLELLPDINDPEGAINIAGIVSTGERGEGFGTRAMKLITGKADENNLGLTLEVDPVSRGGRPDLSKEDLVTFYEREGFIKVNKNYDLETKTTTYDPIDPETNKDRFGSEWIDEMYRPPVDGRMQSLPKEVDAPRPTAPASGSLAESRSVDFTDNLKALQGGKAKILALPDKDAAFTATANLQRGTPEIQMVNTQMLMGGGVLSHAIEHGGDLLHRMTERGGVFSENARPKVKSLIRSLESEYGFGREFTENMRNNYRSKLETAKSRGEEFYPTFEEYEEAVFNGLDSYAAYHSQLPVFNELQKAARDTAISLGKRDFDSALRNLRILDDAIEDGSFVERNQIFDPQFETKSAQMAQGGVVSLVDVARNMNRGPRGVGSLAPIARNMYRTMVS